jgi:hypothetical protein
MRELRFREVRLLDKYHKRGKGQSLDAMPVL